MAIIPARVKKRGTHPAQLKKIGASVPPNPFCLRIHNPDRTAVMGSSDKAASDDVPEKAASPTYPGDSDGVVGEVQEENTYAYDDSRKLGITGAVFLILNKMIGTGIFSTPSGIFAATGSVGISLFLWVIGKCSHNCV
jgi:hypothetical protein